jgi:RimJ/RimL family protein N-acetyltransferase
VIANSALAGAAVSWLAVPQKGKPMLLVDLLDKYPLATKLRDGTPVSVRPVARRDDGKLQKFFLAVPEEERLFVKQPITDQTLFRQWCRQPDFERNLPLLMLHGKKVIGEATLHQRGGGWKRHIGLITLLTHPDYRGRDVSKVLVTELIDIAKHCGLRRLEAEVNGERKIALAVLAQLGFNKLMHLHDYVLDMKATTHDYVLMGRSLKQEEEYAGLGG